MTIINNIFNSELVIGGSHIRSACDNNDENGHDWMEIVLENGTYLLIDPSYRQYECGREREPNTLEERDVPEQTPHYLSEQGLHIVQREKFIYVPARKIDFCDLYEMQCDRNSLKVWKQKRKSLIISDLAPVLRTTP